MPEVLFVGREREQDVYKKFLAKESPWVLIITGLGGIGKTTLLHRLAEYTSSESSLFKTGVVALDFANEDLRSDPLKLLDKLTTDTTSFCDLQRIDSGFKEVLQQNIDQLAQLSIERSQTGVNESEDPALREIHHQMRELATEAFYTQIKTFRLNRLVIMLDTCEWLNEPEGIEVGQWVLNELVPGLHTRIRQQGRQCHVVMVSRVQLKLDVINGRDQQRLTLPMLGKSEVDQYLQHMGMQDADLRQRVFEVTHGLALCVSIIGNFWQQREAQKEPLTIADFPELKLQEFSEIALMQFTNERVLKQLKSPFNELTRYGVLLRSFDLPLLRNVFSELLPEAEALDRFNQLIRYPYIESRGNYRYAFHELLREALAKETQKEEPEEWKGYHKRALYYHTKVANHSPDWYYHLLAYDEKLGLVEWQLAIQEARESGKREFSGALLQAAIDTALNLLPTAQAEVSYEQGRFNYYGVQWEEALKSYNEALAFFKQIDDYSGQAKVLHAMGDVQRALGNHDDALGSYEKARDFYQLVGDQFGEAKCNQAMGDVQRLRYDLDTALRCYEQCLALFQQLKDRSEEAKALEAIGYVQQVRHNLDAALYNYEQALALYQEEKDRLKRAKVLKSIGDVHRLRQDTNAALESYAQALALFGELKEPTEEANVRQAIEVMQQQSSYGQDKPTLSAVAGSSITQPLSPLPNPHLHGYAQQSLSATTPLTIPLQRQGLSRGMVVLGLVGLVLVIIGGSIGLLTISLTRENTRGNFGPPTSITKENTRGSSGPPITITKDSGILAYPSYLPGSGTLALYDPLRHKSSRYNWAPSPTPSPHYGSCLFMDNALHVSVYGDVGVTFHLCIPEPSSKSPTNTLIFSNFVYQIKMTFIQGDCGGVAFRVQLPKLYYFYICQNGQYGLVRYTTNVDSSISPILIQGLSKGILTGSGQANILAVVAQGPNIYLYVNRNQVGSVQNNEANSSYIEGTIGVLAKIFTTGKTEVSFTDATVWTL